MSTNLVLSALVFTSVGCAGRALPFPVDNSGGDYAGVDLARGVGGTDLSWSVGGVNDFAQPVDFAVGNDLPPNSSGRNWSLWYGPGVWTQWLIKTAAIDTSERVFVTDGQNVFAASSSGAAIYLTASAIVAAAGKPSATIHSLDVGPDNRLYILVDDAILVSPASGQVTRHRQVSGTAAVMWLSVVDADHVLVVDYSGLHEVSATGESLLYSMSMIQGGTTCSSQDLAVQRDGIFFYLPGCNGSPLYKGKADGSGAAVLLQAQLMGLDNFNSVARMPSGGFLLSMENDAGSLNEGLLQSDENGNVIPIVTHPSMLDYMNSLSTSLAFHSRPIEVGPSGAIYLVSSDSIYRVSP